MTKKKPPLSRMFALNPRFKYIPEEDRYLSKSEPADHKFNVIGTGANGSEHIRVTMLEGRGTIHGIYDPNPGSITMAKDTFRQYDPTRELVVYDSLEEACMEPEVDGLIISTPNFTHLEVLRTAVKSGKHILLEKPMATTVPDAYEIVKIAREYPAVLQIGLQYRYKTMYQEVIREALEYETIGDIKMISILKHRIPFLDKVKQWNKFAKFSGDTLVEKCCHYLDMLNMFAGSRAEKIYASGGQAVNFLDFERNGEKSDILDNAMVTIEYENGIRASLILCMFAPGFYEELSLCGEKGRIKSYSDHTFLDNQQPNSYMEVMLGDARPSRVIQPNFIGPIEQSGHHGATIFEHIDFIDNIEGKETKSATVDEGFWSIVVAAAAQESIKTGKPVNVKEYLAGFGIEEE